MLVTALVSAALLVSGSGSRSGAQDVMALLLLGSGQNPYEPPAVVQVPAPEVKPEAGLLPAPAPSISREDTALRPGQSGLPVAGQLPAPIARSELPSRLDRLAQAPSANDEILRRLERLEQENQRLRQELQGGAAKPAPAAPPAVSGAMQPSAAPPQMVSGWRVSLYPWNAEGSVSGPALSVFTMRNQRFDGTLGQRPVDRKSIRERFQGATNEMFVYRLDGWLHVLRAGRHELGFEVTCGFDHPCNLAVKLGGVQLLNERRQNFDNKLLMVALDLEARDYPVEVTFGIAKSDFRKFEPARRVTLYPVYRPPGELNFRDFGAGEMLTEANSSVPYGVPRR